MCFVGDATSRSHTLPPELYDAYGRDHGYGYGYGQGLPPRQRQGRQGQGGQGEAVSDRRRKGRGERTRKVKMESLKGKIIGLLGCGQDIPQTAPVRCTIAYRSLQMPINLLIIH
jgi:hypothetical protein